MEAEYSRTSTKKDSANTGEKNIEGALSGSESRENADSYSEQEELSEGELLATLNGTISATITTQKVRKKKKKILKEKPKPAALHIVEYYPPDLAKTLAKDILTTSGINSQTLKFDKKFRELQLLAPATDHCYTPWLSPTQTPVIEKGPDNKVPIQPPEKSQQKLTNQPSVVAEQHSTSNDSKNSTKRQDSIDESPAGDEETSVLRKTLNGSEKSETQAKLSMKFGGNIPARDDHLDQQRQMTHSSTSSQMELQLPVSDSEKAIIQNVIIFKPAYPGCTVMSPYLSKLCGEGEIIKPDRSGRIIITRKGTNTIQNQQLYSQQHRPQRNHPQYPQQQQPPPKKHIPQHHSQQQPLQRCSQQQPKYPQQLSQQHEQQQQPQQQNPITAQSPNIVSKKEFIPLKQQSKLPSQISHDDKELIDSQPHQQNSKKGFIRLNIVPKKGFIRLTQQSKFPSKTTESSHDEEEYVNDAFNKDDDPDKLSCICRKPHNNRFMICCDICEEWFHGTCVNVTKAMGLQMKRRGLYWTCPKCFNKVKTPVQCKISKIFEKKNMVTIPVEKEIVPIQKTLVSQTRQPPTKRESSQTRIVQKKNSDLVILKKIEVKSNPGLIKDLLKVNTRPENEEKEVCKKIEIQKAQKIIEHPKTQQEIEKCVVCRRPTREKTVYCSDECLRKYIHNVVSSRQTGKAPKSSTDIVKKKLSFEEALGAAAVLTPQKRIERVPVFERKTERVLTGGNAPTLTNLKRWLQENQNLEVVQPGSQNALAKETKKRLESSSSESNLETSISTVASKIFKLESKLSEKIASSQTNDAIRPKVLATSILAVPLNASSSALSVCPTTSSMLKVTPAVSNKSFQKSKKKLEKSLEKNNKFEKEKNSDKGEKFEKVSKKLKPKQDESSKDFKTNGKDVRSNIVKNFRKQIKTRMSEISEESHSKLTEDEIEQFAQNIEKELYSLYNKDASSPKYRNKFRSLHFNLRDRKNTTLFHKICAKIVDAKQLVRMTSEELASQELAAWRQQEIKHQLELVKNSELDLLQCTKNYVLKTHKGEEVIEAKTTDRLNLDISQIPVEDVITILNSSTVSITSEEDLNETQIKDDKDSFKVDLEQYDEKIMTESDKIENLASKSKNKTEKLLLKVIPSKSRTETSKKEKNHHKHERSKNSAKSREREWSKEREKSRDRDYREKHKKDRHKEKSKKRSRSRSRERRDHSIRHHKSPEGRVDKRQNDKHHDKNFSDAAAATPTNSVVVSRTTSAPSAHTGTVTSKTKSKSEPLQKFNLVDQTLKSMCKCNSFEKSANIASNTQTIKPALQTEKPLSHPATPLTPSLFDSDQEAANTVQIPTPPSIDDKENFNYSKYFNAHRVWSGSINMRVVGTFQIIIQPVFGMIHNMEKDLSNQLDVFGKIDPETVWEYIAKIKKSANKEIVIVRLLPSQESEYTPYFALYIYLDKRRRLGVVRSESKGIKDFYILPLNGQKYLHSVLQSNSNVDFFDDDTRPDLLLGIIIRVMEPNTSLNMALKRPQTSAANAGLSNKMVCTTETSVISNKHLSGDEDTPSGSPRLAIKSKLITVSETKNILKPEPQPINDDSNDDIIEIVPGVKNQAQSLNSSEKSANIALPTEKPLSHPATPLTPSLFDSDQEPTSTVQIPTPPSIDDEENSFYSKYFNAYRLWTGSINMRVIGTFQIIIQPVSGMFHNMEKDLSNELDVFGKISPETVWDYIAKIKKSANKEIVIVRLLPSQESEYTPYFALYIYLDKRRRLGVVRSESKGIKDFYILPLNGQKYLHSVLQSNSNVEFFDDDTRPDLLLGIIIRVMEPNTSLNMALKRPQTSANAGLSNKMVCTTETSVISNKHLPSDEETTSESLRPATKSKLINVIETKNVLKPESEQIKRPLEWNRLFVEMLSLPYKWTDFNNLYHFGNLKDASKKNLFSISGWWPLNDDSNNDVIEIVPNVKNQAQSLNSSESGSNKEAEQSIIPGLRTTSTSINDDDELNRKMNEINRQIEREKIELAGMLGGSNSSSDSFSNSASAPMATLANIKIPSNLQQKPTPSQRNRSRRICGSIYLR